VQDARPSFIAHACPPSSNATRSWCLTTTDSRARPACGAHGQARPLLRSVHEPVSKQAEPLAAAAEARPGPLGRITSRRNNLGTRLIIEDRPCYVTGRNMSHAGLPTDADCASIWRRQREDIATGFFPQLLLSTWRQLHHVVVHEHRIAVFVEVYVR